MSSRSGTLAAPAYTLTELATSTRLARLRVRDHGLLSDMRYTRRERQLLAGDATDPGTAPLIVLLAASLWPSSGSRSLSWARAVRWAATVTGTGSGSSTGVGGDVVQRRLERSDPVRLAL